MRKLPLLALLCSAFASQADLLDAMKAYEKRDFNTAAQEFSALLPLANELAAFNLAAMAYNGEGQSRDPVKALAYFQLAAELGHAEAGAMAQKVSATLDATAQQQASSQLAALRQQIKVGRGDLAQLLELSDDNRPAIKRVEPQYPVDAAKRGLFGTVTMRMLVNEQGDVESVDVLNAFPKGVFEQAAVKALKRWKYAKADRKTVGRLVLNFSLDEIDQRKMQHIFTEYKLWEYSALGSPMHQNALASVLNLVRGQSGDTQLVDKTLPAQLGPLSADFVNSGKLVSDELQLPDGFTQNAFVTLDDQGVVLSVHDENEATQASLSAVLTGKRLTSDKVAAGFYKLQNRFDKWPARLLTAQRIPLTYSDDYWMQQAARGGNVEAQRAMAALWPEWELYLLEQQDPVVQSWAGTRLILKGQQAEGNKLLDAAIAKGHQTAKELKAAL